MSTDVCVRSTLLSYPPGGTMAVHLHDRSILGLPHNNCYQCTDFITQLFPSEHENIIIYEQTTTVISLHN